MLRTIREAHEQNVHLLSQVNQFNEELTRKIEAATSELAKRNEELKLLNEALFESQRQLGQSEKLAALGPGHGHHGPSDGDPPELHLRLHSADVTGRKPSAQRTRTAQDHRIATGPIGGIRQKPPLLYPSTQTPVKTAWESTKSWKT